VRVGALDASVDLSSAISLARELDFETTQPQHFGAPPATSQPYSSAGFSGSVDSGASCNCNIITLIPHCNGTHTECVGHLTREPVDALRIVPSGLLPALLISVQPDNADRFLESTEPLSQAGDRIVTREAIEGAWPMRTPFEPEALIIRTCGKGLDGDPLPGTSGSPAYLTREAAQLLVERGIEHLVIDLPSIDRDHDAGRLTAHRVFFGLPPRATNHGAASRPAATITELARIPDTLQDGPCLLELQVPAWRGDALPSRPLVYALAATHDTHCDE
jgi:kynurenine formamidase